MFRKCTACDVEMVELSKWSYHITEAFGSINVDRVMLATMKAKKGFIKRAEVETITLIPYVCPKCGKVENYLSETDLKFAIRAEDSKEYSGV